MTEVTKQYLTQKLNDNPAYVIGRALLAIYKNQTEEEKSMQETATLNGIGFTAFDAKLGTKCAEYFKAHNSLQDWMVKVWMKPIGKSQQPKILKYTKQLNLIANARISAH